MPIEHITDHEVRGVARLIERYRKPRISALLASWLSEVQVVEDALWQLLTERSTSTAIGAQLDVLGRIVGQPREGRADDIYRLWIAARTLVNRSSGKTVQLIAITKKLVGDAQVRLEEHYPAALTLHIESGIDGPSGVQIAKLLSIAKAAGVALYLEWFSLDAGDAFTFAPGDTVIEDSPMGFGAGALSAISTGEDVEFWIDPGA